MTAIPAWFGLVWAGIYNPPPGIQARREHIEATRGEKSAAAKYAAQQRCRAKKEAAKEAAAKGMDGADDDSDFKDCAMAEHRIKAQLRIRPTGDVNMLRLSMELRRIFVILPQIIEHCFRTPAFSANYQIEPWSPGIPIRRPAPVWLCGALSA
eukprot:XP_001702631.1 predicted protein [Chlamydomonas reinhardtii]